ncbi:DNA-dependent RNA polymerase beta' subunit/160 kD subunit [Giardia duodenalis]|uniref:DNA-dependent RNA polymerase beta' subunit/160 kD subunit n=1 Tax=Giardia intestinalis TaxID=5741 RepID=V6TV10_GIAIN|nr:DNA-dependent RNA polymerase beta' subunit/160 kD subunit [Giardia intestinalis]
MNSVSAEVNRPPIYHVAKVLNNFLFGSLYGKDEDLEMWEFFVALCCCIGIRVWAVEKEERTTFFLRDTASSDVGSAFSLPNNKVVKWYDLSIPFKVVAEKGARALEEVSIEVSTIPYNMVLEDICALKDCIATTVFPEEKKKVNGVRSFLKARKSK